MILIVDDDCDIASLIKISLEKIGLLVSFFTDPLLALEEFSKRLSNYELVISDIRMPDMIGYEFVKLVKMLISKVKVILITAFETESETEKVFCNHQDRWFSFKSHFIHPRLKYIKKNQANTHLF